MNRQKHIRLRKLSGLAVGLGLGFLATGIYPALQAQVVAPPSGQGTVLTARETPALQREAAMPYPDLTLRQGPLHGAAVEGTGGNIAGQIAVGMLLILLGAGIHAFIVQRRDNRKIPVKRRKRRRKPQERRKRKKRREIIWVERTIRL